jgi:hypothetical protein
MAERTENTRINMYINNAQAASALDGMNKEYAKLRAEQKKLQVGTEEWMKKQKELDGVTKKITEFRKQVDISSMSMKQLREHSNQLKKMRDNLVPGTAEFKKLDKEITAVSNTMKGATGGTNMLGGAFNSLGQIIKANPLLALASIILGLIQALKQNDAVMKVMERTMGAIGAVTGVLTDKIVKLGEWLVKAFENPKQAMQDLYEFVKTNLINRFKAFGVILEGIVNLDFKKIGNGVIQLNTGFENVIDNAQKLGTELLDVAKKQDEITKAMQRLRDEERRIQVLNAQRVGQIDVLMAKSMDLNLSIEERQKALKEANDLEIAMTEDTLRLAKEKMDLIKAENLLSTSNETARQREADAEAEYFKIKAASELKLQQIKNKGSKLEKKENKELEAQEKEKQRLIEKRIALEEEFNNTLAKLRDDQRRRLLSANERELDDVNNKYIKAFAIAKETGQDITELEQLYAAEILQVKEKQAEKERELKQQNFAQVEQELLTEHQREIFLIEEKYRKLMELEGISQEQRIDLEKKKNEAIAALNDTQRLKEEEEWAKSLQNYMTQLQSFYNMGMSVITSFADLRAQQENQDLAAYKNSNDQKKAALEKRLKSGQLSEENYRKQIEQLDRQQNKKEREIRREQFERERRIKTLEILMNTATAITKAIAMFGPPPSPAGIAGIAAAGITGGLQLATVASAQPQFGDGGIFREGVSHAHPSGGMPVLDPRTGKVLAKVEQGEGFVNKDSTAANEALINLMNANRGRTITPDMLGSAQPSVNIGRASQNLLLEKGGILDKGAASSTIAAAQPAAMPMADQSVINLLTQIRDKKAPAVIYLQELKKELNNMEELELSNQIE